MKIVRRLYRKFRFFLCNSIGLHSFVKEREIVLKTENHMRIQEREVCKYCGYVIFGNSWIEEHVKGGSVILKDDTWYI